MDKYIEEIYRSDGTVKKLRIHVGHPTLIMAINDIWESAIASGKVVDVRKELKAEYSSRKIPGVLWHSTHMEMSPGTWDILCIKYPMKN